MGIDFEKDRPIYLQLVERICGELVSGVRKPGDKLPSVREFALEVGVNTNTVQNVYKQLEQMELTETKRGQGTFITPDSSKISSMREELKEQLVDRFLNNVEMMGFSQDEVLQTLKERSER
ncbi:GntR family transcriptional regulator [Neobacillus sp. NPDC058068]|uniref:GntR family transcriptional regulator n=1 Tax=Neobacillus sp. NPDC058068 TaxID=3346325 RepID=UPI0036DC2673